MKRKLKQLIGSMMSVMILTGSVTTSFAQEYVEVTEGTVNDADSVIDNETPSLEIALDYAINFMRTSTESDTLQIDRSVTLHGASGEVTGFYVTFVDKYEYKGYMLLSVYTDDEDPLVEYAFEGRGPLFDDLGSGSPNLLIKEDLLFEEKDINNAIYLGPGQIYIPESNGMYYSAYEKTELDANIISAYINAEFDRRGIVNWGSVSFNQNSQDTFKKIIDFGAGADYYTMEQLCGNTTAQVCSPAAATNILYYWGFKRNRANVYNKSYLRSVFNHKAKALKIYSVVKTGMGTSDYFGTYYTSILAGYQYFFNSYAQATTSGGVWNYRILSNGSNFAEYKNAFLGNCPVHLQVNESNGAINKGNGHCMMGIGYAVSYSNVNYILVMDGWNPYGRFVKYNYYPFVIGYKIYVS